MEHRWERIREWIEMNAPALADGLRPSATSAAISAAAAEIGLDFPPSVQASYRCHDGQEDGTCSVFGGWRLLPLTEVVTEWETQRTVARNGFDHWDPDTAIPIMTDDSGALLYVEHAPDGTETPVIQWWYERPSRDVQASSFVAYVDEYIEALEAGKFVYLEDEGRLVHESYR